MSPADLRNATWTEVLKHVTEDMQRVHNAWMLHGPGTTKTVARKAGLSLFTFRPRTTDLYKLGLVEITGKKGTEGIYEYRTELEAEESRAWQEDRTSHSQGPRATAGAAAQSTGIPVFTSQAQKIAWAASIMGQHAKAQRRRTHSTENMELSFA